MNEDNDQPAPIRRLQLAVPRMALAETKDGGKLLLARLPFGRVYAARLGASQVILGEEAQKFAKMVDGAEKAPRKKRVKKSRPAAEPAPDPS